MQINDDQYLWPLTILQVDIFNFVYLSLLYKPIYIHQTKSPNQQNKHNLCKKL